MEIIFRASKWVVGEQRLQEGLRLPPVRAFIEDITTMMSFDMFHKLNSHLQWARLKIEPNKSRSFSSVKGKVVGRRFVVNDEVVLTVLEKPVKSLGRW